MRYKHHRRYKKSKCLICNKEGEGITYCRKCRIELILSNPEFSNNYKDGRSLKKYKCIVCNKEVVWQTWCYGSKKCRICANKGRNNPNYGIHRFGKDAPGYKDGRCLNKYCIDCNKKITPGSKYGRCKGCATKINWKKEIYQNKIQNSKGKKHPMWQGGISKLPYAFEFNDSLKESIRKKDNYTCQNCGLTEKKHLKLYNTLLNIHHIDYNKTNCNEDNLISTCFGCNIKANTNRDYWYAYFTYIREKNE